MHTKLCSRTEPKWSVGHIDEWQYKTKEESEI